MYNNNWLIITSQQQHVLPTVATCGSPGAPYGSMLPGTAHCPRFLRALLGPPPTHTYSSTTSIRYLYACTVRRLPITTCCSMYAIRS